MFSKRCETSKNHGLLHLQEILLSNVVGEFKIKLTSVEQGVSTIQRRLQQKKVLLILDDVDKEEQLQHIVGRPDLLGPDSRVIITTRNQQLLADHGVERTYKVKELKKEHATKLFTKNQEVNSTYEDLLNQALSYASGLPLALELISSNLFGKTREEWESTLEQYKRIPPRDIQKILEVSFDALEEEEKNVFLDIACCFKGYKLEEVKDILCAHYGFCIANHIRVLVQKSLITITPYWMKTVTLHDLIEDMGKEIVRQESPKEPGNRSRIWSLEDIFEVLEENTKLETMKVLNLDSCGSLTQIPNLSGLPNLEELSFAGCSKLITIDCSVGLLDKLQILDVVHCSQLRSFPPLKLPFLEDLCLIGCSSLESFPEILKESSMLLPSKVEHLTLKNCDLLDEYLVLVPSLLPNLKELNLDGCSSITVIPECTKECRFLRRLGLLVCKQLREIFEGILLNLTHLSVRYCPSLSSSCRSMLLRQELHEDVEINLELQGVRIPEWFEYKGGSPSLSFWFRNNFPRILLCTVASHYTPSHLTFFINGYSWDSFSVNWGHTLLSRLRERLEDRYIENEWNHTEFKWMKCMWNDRRVDSLKHNPGSLLLGLYILM